MAIEKVVSIKVDSKQAEKNVKELNDTILEQKEILIDLQKELLKTEDKLNQTPKTALSEQKLLNDRVELLKNSIKDQNIALKELNLEYTKSKGVEKQAKEQEKLTKEVKKTNEATKKTAKSAKNTEGAFKSVKNAVTAVGKGLKALGIGLIVSAIAALTGALTQNQKVLDFFNTALTAAGIVIRDFVEFVTNNFGTVVDFFKDVFENPTKFIKELGEEIKRNLIERFVSLLEVAGFLSDAFVKLFAGDFKGALDSVKAAAVESVDVLTGVDNALEVAGEAISKAGNAIAEYGAEVIKTAQNVTTLQNNALLAAAEQGRLVEKYDRLAEQQRQIRDEERNSIDDRIKANNELGEILEKQEKALLAQADAQIAAASANLAVNDNIENQIALTDALANREGVLAQVEGFRSEQKVNDLALDRERLELAKTRQDAEAELTFQQRKFNAERIEDDLMRLEALKQINEEEAAIELERLQGEINLYNEGTQARVDAEIEFQRRKQELKQEGDLIDEEISNKEIERAEAVKQAKIGIALNTLELIRQIAGEDSKVGKAAAAAQAVISGIQGVQNAYTSAAASPITKLFPAYPLVQAGLAGAFSALQVKKILSTDPTGRTTPNLGGGAAGGGGSAQPSFNVVGTSGVNQIAQQLGQEQEPIQAYVVGSNVTTQQGLDRNIVQTASIG